MNNKLIDSESGAATVLTPTFCCFSVCDSCVLRCKMCFKWKDDIFIKPDENMLTLAEWKSCALSLKQFALDDFMINFGGGEVLMVPWILELVSFCHGLKFKTNIATNGFLVDEAMSKKMHEVGLDYIIISLDSLDEVTHDSLRGKTGVYQRVIRAIDLIHQNAENVKIGLCSIIMEQTLAGIIELAQWAQKNEKVELIYFMSVMQPNNTYPNQQWYLEDFKDLWPKDIKKVTQVIDELIRLKKSGYKIGDTIVQLEAYKAYFLNPENYVKKSSCNINRAVHVSSIGDVFMCYNFERLGNLREKRLKDLWVSDFASKIRHQIKDCKQNCHFLLNCNFEDVEDHIK